MTRHFIIYNAYFPGAVIDWNCAALDSLDYPPFVFWLQVKKRKRKKEEKEISKYGETHIIRIDYVGEFCDIGWYLHLLSQLVRIISLCNFLLGFWQSTESRY